MRKTRLPLMRLLKLKRLLLLLLAVVLVLVLVVFLKGHYPTQALSEISLPKAVSPWYHVSKEEMEEEFMHLERQWKEPTWPVAAVLRHPPSESKFKPVLPVIVVEEHYEVLKYWFDAASTGVIPKHGNTLLHINGHSDAAPPRDLSLVPWFRLPLNHSEVANMMQSNDVFIAGSALAGLISRFIWVWPDWDRKDHTSEGDHEVSEVKAGWRTYFPHQAKPFHRHCVCARMRFPNITDDWECWDDEPDSSEFGGGSVIKSQECHGMVTGVMESIHERKALELLKKGGWIREDEKVMLDIDEDYYGCESSVMPLYKAGLTQRSIEQISGIVRKFLCVNDVHSEFIADKVFRTIVQIVRDFRANLCGNGASKSRDKCLSEVDADTALIQMMPAISSSLRKAGVGKLICNGKAGEVMLQILLRKLLSLETRQLDSLNYVGACLEQAPTSIMFEPKSLHICHGFNVPGQTEVTFHVPTAKENEMRTEILRATLSLLPKEPTLVTVCRSIRDGYTPWASFTDIEKAVMEALQSVFKGVTEKSFHYDENLLGGRKGWPTRHQA